MPLQIAQSDRPLTATTPLGDDFVPFALNGEEAVSRPFLFTVDFASPSATIAPQDLLGQGVTLHMLLANGDIRNFHGIVRRFTNLGSGKLLTHYRTEIVPAIWFMSLFTDCRTFETLTPIDIVMKVCRAANVTDIRQRIATVPPAQPYVVQYQESDLAFISRMLEAWGLYYSFAHESGKHTVVFSDSHAGSIPPGLVPNVLVDSQFAGSMPKEDTVFRFSREYAVHTAGVSLTDHDLLRPDNVDSVTSNSPKARGQRYGFLGDLGPNRSRAEAMLLIEGEEGERDIVRGSSTCAAFESGTRVELAEGPLPSGGEEFHLLKVIHRMKNGDVHAGGKIEASYENDFVAIPAATQYRPPRVTPRPSVHGTQTAKVVGAGGPGNIDVDAEGRVLLQFPWDRGDGKNAGSRHRVHVASLWSGTQWGFVQHPRVGQEVLVEFLEGDPDRSIVTGRVYNISHKPPYDLPAKKTQSGWKSRTLNGGADNFNEIRFDDEQGSEHIAVQAEKDLNVVVKNDETREVRHDRITDITNDDTRTVKEGNDTHKVSAGNQTVTVKGNQALTVNDGNRSAKIEKGNDALEVSMGNMTVGVKMGNIDIKADLGKITIEAMQKIELKVGSNSIVIDMMGITLKGLNVKSEAQVQAEFKGLMTKIEGTVQAQVKGVMTQVNGDAMLMAKGGITMIN